MSKAIQATIVIGAITELSDDLIDQHSILECDKHVRVVKNLKETMLHTLRKQAKRMQITDIKFEVVNLPDNKSITNERSN